MRFARRESGDVGYLFVFYVTYTLVNYTDTVSGSGLQPAQF